MRIAENGTLKADTLLDLLDLIQEYPCHLHTRCHFVSLIGMIHEDEQLTFKQRNTVYYLHYHDMWSNPDAVDRKASVELKWTATLQGFHCTVKRPSVWILSSSIRLHLLNLCLNIVEGQTASRCKES